MRSHLRQLLTSGVSLALLLIASVPFAKATEFVPLGFEFSGNAFVSSISVAENGSVVVGNTPDDKFYRWTPSTGTEFVSGNISSLSISGDGSTIAATWRSSSRTLVQATSITESGTEVLPNPTGERSSRVSIISQDGSTIFGNTGNQMARWVDGAYVPFIPFPFPSISSPRTTSASGDILLFGRSRWSEDNGVEDFPVPGSPEQAFVFGLSSSGRWAVGRIRESGGNSQNWAVRWDGLSAPERLLPANGDWGATGFDVTSNGSLVVGSLYPTDDSITRQAGVWTETTGMFSLQDFLITEHGLGAALDGWRLSAVHDVTDNGRFMVGLGINPAGDNEAFFVEITPVPEPTTAVLLLVALVRLTILRRNA